MAVRIGARMPLGRKMVFAAAIIGAAGLGLAAPGAQAKELKLAHFMSPKHPMHVHLMAPMVQELAKVSGGDLTIRIYPGGELGKGPAAQFKRAVTGVADITFGLHGYTSNLFPRTTLVELPGISSGPVQATKMLWAAYDKYLSPEYKRVVPLALWANDEAVLITRTKPIRSLADVVGMKFRVPSRVAANLVKAWGGTPVFLPAPKIYNALSTGIVDGVFIGASGITSFKLIEAGNHMTVGIPVTIAGMYLVMNKGSYDKLTDSQKKALNAVSGLKASLRAAAAYEAAGKRAVALFAKQKTVHTLTAENAAAFRAAADKMVAQLLVDMDKKGIPASDAVKAMKAAK